VNIVRADPAGNITIFVLDPIDDPALRIRASKALLAEPSLKAEQVGFVISPERRDSRSPARWRLEMMGGEFCGNAARSFGLYTARKTGLTGKQDILVEVSGAADPVPVHADLNLSTAEAEIPGPVAAAVLDFEGRPLPVYFFEGIAHIIIEDTDPCRALVLRLLECAQRAAGIAGQDALGLMFCKPGPSMRPVVHVRAADSLVYESSCGSGTAALAAHLSAGLGDGEYRWDVAQNGGVISARLVKEAGKIRRIGIGGPVTLEGPISLRLPGF
jgi:diaminopimelate epimerase